MTESANETQKWAGQRLGFPEFGSGSLAKTGRRVLALSVDWVVSVLLAFAFFRHDANGLYDNNVALAVFAFEQILLLATAQATIGHRVLGLKLVRLDGQPIGILPAVIRTALLLLVIPAAIWDADNRGLHDKAAKTALVLR